MIIQSFFALLRLVLTFALIFLSYAHMKRNIGTREMIYCFFCDIGALQLIIFQIEGLHEVRICSVQVFSGCHLLVVGRFRSFLARCRSFQLVSDRFLLVVGRFRSFYVISGRSAF